MINFKDFTGLKESAFFISQDEKQVTIDMNGLKTRIFR